MAINHLEVCTENSKYCLWSEMTKDWRKKKLVSRYGVGIILCVLLTSSVCTAQTVLVAPLSCYTPLTPAQQNTIAINSSGVQPFATWKAAYDYAISNSISTIHFLPGKYNIGPGGTNPIGVSLDWGDANGGFDLPANMVVDGHGAVLDNSANGSSQLCFATIAGNNASISNFTFIQFTGNNAGAVLVNQNLTGWSINNTNFDHCDWAGDALVVNMGTTGNGTISGCKLYNNIQSTGSALTITGANTSTTDLNIINTQFVCNLRIAAGGAVKIESAVRVDFSGCLFAGNEANASIGGGIVIRNNALVSFTNTNFTCNLTSGGTTWDGGAVAIESGSNATFTGCTFTGNGGNGLVGSPIGPPDGVGDPTTGNTRYGGAIYAAGQAASLITLNINNCTFDGNLSSTGAAIYLNDANTTLSNSYFTGNNATAEGGGVYVSKGNNTASLTFTGNRFTGNDANGPCTGIDVFTEAHIAGSNNDLQFLADGHKLSNNPGSLQFNNGDDCDLLSNWTTTSGTVTVASGALNVRGGTPLFAYANQQETGTGKLYWTFTAYTANSMTGFDTLERAMAFVLGGSSSNFTTGIGYAIVKGRNGTGSIEFVSYTNGIDADANLTPLQLFATPVSEDGYITFKVIYDASKTNAEWSFYYTFSNSGGPIPTNEADPRGYYWCGTSAPSTFTTFDATAPFSLSTTPFVGPVWNASSSVSTNLATFNNYYFRAGDETDGTGLSATYAPVACTTCISSPTVTNSCLVGATCSSTNVTCGNTSNGTALVTAVSGVAPYTYLWSNNSTIANPAALVAGTYTVTVTDAIGLTTTCSTTVLGSASPVAPTGISGGSSLCAGSSQVLNVTGGSPGSGGVAEWFAGSCGGTVIGSGSSLSVTPAATTTYYVRYNGPCGATTCVSLTVTVNPLPLITGIHCPGCGTGNQGYVNLTVQPSNSTLLWNTGQTTANISQLSVGTYTVTATTPAGCTSSKSFIIN
nr:hypothetical protein [Bacteroidota bacterium]